MIAHRSPSRSLAVRRREGFTLLEILVVVAIIVILAGVATFAYTRYIDDAKNDTAAQSARVLEQGCKNFMLKFSRPPETLNELLQPPDGGRPYVESAANLVDPWERPFQYNGTYSSNGIDPDPLVYCVNPSTNITIWAAGRKNHP